MARLEQLPGLKVSIVVDGKILPEYIDPEGLNGPEYCTQYVEAATGANFSLLVRFDGRKFLPPDGLISISLDVDGLPACMHTFSHNQIAESSREELRYACRMTGDRQIKQELRFARLVKEPVSDEAPDAEELLDAEGDLDGDAEDLPNVDEDGYTNQKPDIEHQSDPEQGSKANDIHDANGDPASNLENLGAITAVIHSAWWETKKTIHWPRKSSPRGKKGMKPIFDDNCAPENVLIEQGISHQVDYGPIEANDRLNHGPAPFGPFLGLYQFKYRSHSALKALGFDLPENPIPEQQLLDGITARQAGEGEGGVSVFEKSGANIDLKGQQINFDFNFDEEESTEHPQGSHHENNGHDRPSWNIVENWMNL